MPDSEASFKVGAKRTDLYLSSLENKKVGLVVNQTSLVDMSPDNSSSIHLVDMLVANKVNVEILFAPEHGIRGNKSAGEPIQSSQDPKTLIRIQSIYGKHKTPPKESLQKLDSIIFDIQDVGTRFYTYISSMHYMMEAAAANNIEFIVLDRPNPNGEFIDGPVLDENFQSFVGMHPIPVLHGLSVGELALMIKGEKWIKNAEQLKLRVIPMQAYYKAMPYAPPVPPSPNLPNYQAIRLYPSLCFFEPTAVSIGRGTDFPFQVTGHDSIHLGQFSFTPVSKPNAAKYPKFENTLLHGLDLRNEPKQGLDLSLLIKYHQAFIDANEDFYQSISFFDKLAGTDELRKAIVAGNTEIQIKQSWQAELQKYKVLREAYLLYPDQAKH